MFSYSFRKGFQDSKNKHFTLWADFAYGSVVDLYFYNRDTVGTIPFY